jgi:hypothetical protein
MPNAACECNSQISLAVASNPSLAGIAAANIGNPDFRPHLGGRYCDGNRETRAEILLYSLGPAPLARTTLFHRLQNFRAGTN